MFLKQLELNGFKSFAQKTVLEFPAGITAIVGPNGSGKSNIIDCIRWLLGEREAKNLRGAKVEDLIWNGTPGRPRLSMAQAGLFFDNGSGFFPVDFKEVAVVRRVGRDGNSEYFLNKSEVRLKDIVDFFSRSRLGTKGLTVIGQGSSDLFVRATPEERRTMIEEILGLREYQLKKNEAERKLKNTFFNLEKVKAMINEVVPRLRLLKRQTGKWSKRMGLAEELKRLENDYFSFRLGEIAGAEEEILPRLSSLEKSVAEKQKELKALESEIKKISSQPEGYEEIKRIKAERGKFFRERSEAEKEFGRLEGRLEFSLRAKDTASADFGKEELLILIKETKKILEGGLNGSFEELKNLVSAVIKKIDNFLAPAKSSGNESRAAAEIVALRDGLNQKISGLEKKIGELDEAERKITTALENSNKRFQKNFELVEEKRDELRKSEGEKSRFVFEKERLGLKRDEIKNKLAEIGRSLDEFDLKGARPLGDDELQAMEKKMFRLRTEISSIGEIDETFIKEAEEVQSHYNFLTNQSEDLEVAAGDLKKMIKELGEKILSEFNSSLKLINAEFNKFFRLMFGGGSAKLRVKNYELRIKNKEGKSDHNDENSEQVEKSDRGAAEDVVEEEGEAKSGIEIDLTLPQKKITGLDILSGGEKSLVSIAALFSLIAVSPPPFLVLDEIDAALDESNSQRFANLVKEFSKKTQFLIATHNRATMEAADVLYGVTMGDDGASKIYSLRLETASSVELGPKREK